MRVHVKPEKFDILPRQAAPPPKYMDYYTSDENRGFLSELVQRKAVLRRVGKM